MRAADEIGISEVTVLILGAGVTPAQGGVEPAAGSHSIKFFLVSDERAGFDCLNWSAFNFRRQRSLHLRRELVDINLDLGMTTVVSADSSADHAGDVLQLVLVTVANAFGRFDGVVRDSRILSRIVCRLGVRN